MENNQETQTMSQEPIMNKKMTTCKTCGSAMAKSAKKCPSCGAKNKIRKLKKLIISVAIIFVFFIVITIMQQPTKATVGKHIPLMILSLLLNT